MADYILALGSLALLIVVTLVVWRRLRGPSTSTFRTVGRVAIAVIASLALIGASAYKLTKSRDFQLAGDLVSRVETADKVVALTFDDGPVPINTESTLAILKDHNAHATFYLTGGDSSENRKQVREIAEAGHEIGNHTYTHPRLYFMSGARVADEIERTDAAIRAAGYEGPITFRPPGCKRLLTAPLYVASTGRTTVTWDLEPDSIAGIQNDADAITAYVLKNVRPGSIVLMHVMYDSREPSRRALPRILDGLTAQGYRFVTVSELKQLAQGQEH